VVLHFPRFSRCRIPGSYRMFNSSGASYVPYCVVLICSASHPQGCARNLHVVTFCCSGCTSFTFRLAGAQAVLVFSCYRTIIIFGVPRKATPLLYHSHGQGRIMSLYGVSRCVISGNTMSHHSRIVYITTQYTGRFSKTFFPLSIKIPDCK
jgi:hypothetical protein